MAPGLRIFLSGLVMSALAACSPSLDWREVRSLQAGLVVLFPCKPKLQQRTLQVSPAAPAEWPAALQVCDAQGITFAVLTMAPAPELAAPVVASGPPPPARTQAEPIDLAAGARPTPAEAIQALQQSGAQRWGGPVVAAQGPTSPSIPTLPGALAPQWQRYSRSGPNAQTVETLALFFQHRGAVVQMTLSGTRIDPAAVESFFGGLRLEP